MNTIVEETLDVQLSDIRNKLDFVVEQMREHERRQREIQELKADITLIAKDLFQSAAVELDEVAQHFDTKDLLHLLKKLFRNTRNLNEMIDQLESTRDLIRDAAPLGKILFEETLNKLNELDSKGYFAFLRELSELADTIVTSFSAEDVRLLREDIVSILLTVKSMTQPEILSVMNSAAGFFEKLNVPVGEDISYFKLLKELRKPEVKRGFAFMLQFIQSIANPKNNNQTLTASTVLPSKEN